VLYRARVLINRGKDILKTEGLVPLVRRGFARYVFQWRSFYLYEIDLTKENEADFVPRAGNFAVRVVCNNEQANEIAADSLDIRLHFINAHLALDKGAAALCIFVDGELAHIGWLAMCEEAKSVLDYLPYKVGFDRDEGCTGGVVTTPKYRGLGLWWYSFFKRLELARDRGLKTVRFATGRDNIAIQAGLMKSKSRRYAEARYLKVLRWCSWKERPL